MEIINTEKLKFELLETYKCYHFTKIIVYEIKLSNPV